MSEEFLKGAQRVLVLVSQRTLQNPFKTPSRTLRKPFQEGVEIDDALGFPGLKISSGSGGPAAGAESLDLKLRTLKVPTT